MRVVDCEAIGEKLERLLVQQPQFLRQRITHTRGLEFPQRNAAETFPTRQGKRPAPKISERRKQIASFPPPSVWRQPPTRMLLVHCLPIKESFLARILRSFKEKNIFHVASPFASSANTTLFRVPALLTSTSLGRAQSIRIHFHGARELSGCPIRSPIPEFTLRWLFCANDATELGQKFLVRLLVKNRRGEFTSAHGQFRYF